MKSSYALHLTLLLYCFVSSGVQYVLMKQNVLPLRIKHHYLIVILFQFDIAILMTFSIQNDILFCSLHLSVLVSWLSISFPGVTISITTLLRTPHITNTLRCLEKYGIQSLYPGISSLGYRVWFTSLKRTFYYEIMIVFYVCLLPTIGKFSW